MCSYLGSAASYLSFDSRGFLSLVLLVVLVLLVLLMLLVFMVLLVLLVLWEWIVFFT